MKARLLFLVLLVLTLSVHGRPQDSKSSVGGVLVSPLLHRKLVKPGQKVFLSFTLENPSQVRQLLDGTIENFQMEDWTYRTIYGKEHARDCRDWFSQRTIQVSLDPGQRRELRLQVDIPRGSEGVYWAMVKLTPRPNGSTTKSLLSYEIPLVLVSGKNPKPNLVVHSPVLNCTQNLRGSKAFTAVLPIENPSQGFTPIGAIGEVRNTSSNRVVARMRLEDRNLMPGTKRQLVFLLPALPDGRYRLAFRAQLGAKSLPEVTSEYVLSKGASKTVSELNQLTLAPVTVEPNAISSVVPAGGSRTISLRVTNNSNRPLHLDISPAPIQQALNGSLGIGAGDLPIGLNVGVQTSNQPLEPGETRAVRVTMSRSAATSGDAWFALSLKERGNGQSIAESIFGTVTVVKGSKPLIAVEDPRLIMDGKTPVAIKFTVRNTGNVALRPEPSATVLEGGVRLVERPAVPIIGDGGLLPGSVVDNVLMLPQKLKAGEYVVEILYQYGDKDFARARVPIRIVAPIKLDKSAPKG